MNSQQSTLRSLTRRLLASSYLLVLTAAAFAQPATGAITGTVADSGTRQFLNQAEVRIQGTDLVALTDNEGYFRLAGVPAGQHTVQVNYLGLDPGQFNLTVAAGQTVTRALELKSRIHVLGEFVVSSDREGQAAALNQQRNADHMKSVVAADAFGDLHDNNAAELLKSVPGITLNYSGEDAIGFVMRGQDSTYATIATDGNPMASGANNGPAGRLVNFRNVTVNNIESVEINRAPTAAQPANSLGGSVNFVSKSAFSQKGRRLRLDVGVNFNTDSAQLGRSYEGLDKEAYTLFPAVQLNYSDAFRRDSEHPIGIVANALLGGRYLHNTAFNRTYTYVPAVAAGQQVSASTPAIATNLVLSEAAAGWRQRSLGVNADYKFSERTTGFLRASYQEGPQSYMYGLNHGITFFGANQTAGAGAAMTPINANSANTIDSRPNATPVAAGASTGSRITKTSGTQNGDTQWYQLGAGAKQRLGALTLDYDAYFGRAYDGGRRTFPGIPNIGTFTYDVTNVGFLAQNVQDPDGVTVQQTSGADYRNVANYGRLTWTRDTRFSLDRRWGAKLNAKWEVPGLPMALQGGLSDNVQNRKTTGTSTGARTWFGTGPDGVFGNADDVRLDLGQFADARLTNGWDHRGPTTTVNTGQWVDAAKVWEYAAAHPEVVTRDQVLGVTIAHANKDFTETIPAAYLMATARLGKLTVVPGIRWEETTDVGGGWGRLNTPAIPAGLPLAQQAALTEAQYRWFSRRTTYHDFYPNVQAKYHLTPNLLARSAYTETIGRPNFGTLVPGDTVNVTTGTIARNNPGLEPFSAKSYDFSAEYYFAKNTGSLTAAVFRKDITNYFTTVSSLLPGGAANGYEGLYEGYTVSQQQNIPGLTRTQGYELGYQQSLRFLPGELRNLIVSTAYTHLSSSPPPGVLKVTGIYPDVFFGGVTYAGHGLRLDVKYNLRKQWSTAVNNTNGELTYNKDDGRWDLAIDYRFLRRYEFYCNWRNLSGSVAATYIGKRRLNYTTSGSLINIGVRTDF
ncbi:MAG: hypothetical protein RL077_508 [Verrucomicrobiota bacterium]|jgi:TonB-dependent receptor